jgi:hypothetical protein
MGGGGVIIVSHAGDEILILNPLKNQEKFLVRWKISRTFAEYEMNIHFEAYGSIEKSADWRTEL